MKLTDKDRDFLEKLKALIDSHDLWVELKPCRPSYMVLEGTYGVKTHKIFRTTRQGVRWRFYRLFNQAYVEAFETILFLEKTFGTQSRDYAVRMSRERYALRKENLDRGFTSAAEIVGK